MSTLETIDKNDVDISRLFKWGKEITIYDSDGEDLFKAYVRVVGDYELNRARVYALRKSAELRKKLRTEDTDERLAFIPDLEEVETSNIIELILNQSIKLFATEIIRNVEMNLPKEPDSYSTLEEEEEYQKKVDNWPQEREKLISLEITKKLNSERKKLENLSREELEKDFISSLINNLCETEMINKFSDMCTYYSAYKDPEYKERFFSSVEQFTQLPTSIKEQFTREYESLDIKANELKK